MKIEKYASTGVMQIIEKIIRSHPLVYYIIRSIIRFTNIFEEDVQGVIYLNLGKKINLIDAGASDGVASKFFSKQIKINKILCFEPDRFYVKILRKLKIKNLNIYNYGISEKNQSYKVYFPRYKLFNINFDLIPYTFYEKKELIEQINLDFKFKKNLQIVEKNIYLRKIKNLKFKISLIKIDVNGHEFSVIKGLAKIIKRDKPAIIIETNKDIFKIERFLKILRYKMFMFEKKKKKFIKIRSKFPLNTFLLQPHHLN